MHLEGTPFKNIPVHEMPVNSGVYAIINKIQDKLSEFAWLSKSFGRAVKAGVKGSDGNETYPVVFVEGKDPASVKENDNIPAYSLMYCRDPETPEEDYEEGLEIVYRRTIDLIIIYDQQHVDSSKSYSISEEVKNDIKTALSSIQWNCNDAIEIVNIFDEPDRIFEHFTSDFIETQAFVFPRHGLRFELIAYFNVELDSYATPINQPVTELTLSNTDQSFVVDSPITPIAVTAITGNIRLLAIDGNSQGAFAATGLTLNSGAGVGQIAITGTLLMHGSFTLVGIGADGRTIASVTIDTEGADEIDITINANAYASVSVNTDIPVLNSNATPVGTVYPNYVFIDDSFIPLHVNNELALNLSVAAEHTSLVKNIPIQNTEGAFVGDLTPGVYPEVLIQDSDISITLDSVEIDTATVPAEGAVVVPIDGYTTDFEVNDVDEGDINLASPTGIDLVDDEANVVSPESILQVGNKFQIEVTKPVFTVTQAYYDGLTTEQRANKYWLIDG